MNRDMIVATIALIFVALLAYTPVVWLTYRYCPLRPLIRFIYVLTAVPVFLGLLVINICLVLKFWPAGPQLMQQANAKKDKFTISAILLVFSILPLAGSWLWYRFFAWLNLFSDLDPPNQDAFESTSAWKNEELG